MNKDQFIYNVCLQIKENPSWAKDVIDACVYGVLESNKEINERLVKAEKTAYILFEGNKFEALLNENNIKDMADSLSNSHFVGTGRKFTVEDVKEKLNLN